MKQKLDSEEKEILDAFESGKLHSVPHAAAEKKRFQNIAKRCLTSPTLPSNKKRWRKKRI